MIPFAVTIPAAERDHQLSEKLKAEWPGVLAWLIQGCVEWRRDGLQPPKAVQEATDAYLEAEDGIAAWIDDKCERDRSAWEQSTGLFASWTGWAERAGENAGSMKHFVQMLESRGFQAQRKMHGRGFGGIRIVRESQYGANWNPEA